MASKKSSGKMGKAAFVRTLPQDMPARDVVSKAKEHGIDISEKHVHVIRSNDRRKAGSAKTRGGKKGGAGKKAGAGRRGRKPATGGLSKREFVESMPNDMPAKQVITEAAKKGMTITSSYIYTLRSGGAKKAGGSTGARRGRRPGISSVVSNAGGSGQEKQFMRLAIDLGLSRAEALLGNVRRRLESLSLG